MPWINQSMCVGCGICVDYCPTGSISQQAGGKAVIDNHTCIQCGKCYRVCPIEAIWEINKTLECPHH